MEDLRDLRGLRGHHSSLRYIRHSVMNDRNDLINHNSHLHDLIRLQDVLMINEIFVLMISV